MKRFLDSSIVQAQETQLPFSADISALRPKKQDAFSYWATLDFETRDTLEIKTVEHGLCLPLREAPNLEYGQGGVADREGHAVKESAILDRLEIQHHIDGVYPVDEDRVQTRNQTVLYCGFFHHHFGHFLVEGMVRLWACPETPDVDAYVFISSEVYLPDVFKPSGNSQRILELLGIADKVEIIDKPTRFEKVLVPEPGYQRITYTSKPYERFLQTVIDRALAGNPVPEPAKYFFSRKAFDASHKKEFGYDYLEHLFEKNGYQIVYPEQWPIDQLIALMHSATEIAVMQGSSHHNLLFAPKGLKITVLERFPMVNEYEIDIHRIYGRRWMMLWYYESQLDVLYEAYQDSEKEFHAYLVEKKPVFFKEYFDTNFLRYLKRRWKKRNGGNV